MEIHRKRLATFSMNILRMKTARLGDDLAIVLIREICSKEE